LGQDIGAIKLIISHAAAVHGGEVSVEPVNLARIALRSLGLIGKGNERDRRPTEEELKAPYGYFDSNPHQIVPMSRIIKFAIASAMRQEGICRITWDDLFRWRRLRKEAKAARLSELAFVPQALPASTTITRNGTTTAAACDDGKIEIVLGGSRRIIARLVVSGQHQAA
jgi:hypothetical protein